MERRTTVHRCNGAAVQRCTYRFDWLQRDNFGISFRMEFRSVRRSVFFSAFVIHSGDLFRRFVFFPRASEREIRHGFLFYFRCIFMLFNFWDLTFWKMSDRRSTRINHADAKVPHVEMCFFTISTGKKKTMITHENSTVFVLFAEMHRRTCGIVNSLRHTYVRSYKKCTRSRIELH